jgi:hypothetical protein
LIGHPAVGWTRLPRPCVLDGRIPTRDRNEAEDSTLTLIAGAGPGGCGRDGMAEARQPLGPGVGTP